MFMGADKFRFGNGSGGLKIADELDAVSLTILKIFRPFAQNI